jgi:hypothetical protein
MVGQPAKVSERRAPRMEEVLSYPMIQRLRFFNAYPYPRYLSSESADTDVARFLYDRRPVLDAEVSEEKEKEEDSESAVSIWGGVSQIAPTDQTPDSSPRGDDAYPGCTDLSRPQIAVQGGEGEAPAHLSRRSSHFEDREKADKYRKRAEGDWRARIVESDGDWHRLRSRSDPGHHFYYNEGTRGTQNARPAGFFLSRIDIVVSDSDSDSDHHPLESGVGECDQYEQYEQ